MTLTFKGFDDWVEIFQGGRQTDSNGVVHDGDAMIDRAVNTFDIDHHEPPAVVGHPKENSPAFAWVKDLKSEIKDGVKRLYARFASVVPEFEEAVKSGMYKKRSASFYPDGRLRHVGWLGGMPPAVKGLANLSFSDDAGIAFEFAEPSPWTWQAIAGVMRRLREYFIEKEGAEKADAIIPEWDIQDVSEEQLRAAQTNTSAQESGPMKFSEFFEAFKIWKKIEKDPAAVIDAGGNGSGTQFSEADIEAAKKAAAEEAETRVRAEFAENQRTESKKRRDAQVAEWVESQVAAGIIPPAIRDDGLVAFMQGLPDEPIQFAEGQEKKSGLDWFKGFIGTLGKSPLFAEMATKGAAGKRQGEAEAEIALGKEIGARANR